jgi:hypothetical protein
MRGSDSRFLAHMRSHISENVSNISPNFRRSQNFPTNFAILRGWDPFFCAYGAEILRNFAQECFPMSQVTSQSTNFPTQNGLNITCICQFLHITCSWFKHLHTIFKQPVRRDCKRRVVLITSVTKCLFESPKIVTLSFLCMFCNC